MTTEKPILVFEYFTANGINNQSIVLEAISMIKSLTDDLKHKNINLIISKNYKQYFNDKNINTTFINEPLEEWLQKNSKNFTKAIFIADETEGHLYNITKILEKNNVKIYCPDSNSVKICSDKFLTYNNLKNKIKQPKTFKIKINTEWKTNILKIFNEIKSKIIIKPVKGVDCDNVKIISTKEDIQKLNKQDYTDEILIQEYITGESCSVSLLSDGKNALPLSLNKQNINTDNYDNSYNGGMLPYNHKLKKEAFKIAKNAIENIKGLKGFVGVDLIINDEITFIEINSRFTTPYIGLKEIIDFNIADAIFKILDNEITLKELENFNLNGKIEFLKENNDIKLNKLIE